LLEYLVELYGDVESKFIVNNNRNVVKFFLHKIFKQGEVATQLDSKVERKLIQDTNQKYLSYEADVFFNESYDLGLELTKTPTDSLKRRERFYNLVQFFKQTFSLDGAIAECGCWKGLSSFLLCNYLLSYDSNFKGNDYYVFDSFEGLSTPAEKDSLPDRTISKLSQNFGTVEGAYYSSLEELQSTLSSFPDVTYYKGWLPEKFQEIPEKRYRFVHIDLDLYEPTAGAVRYFYPRLVEGAWLVCDDYGSLFWPGAKKAIDEYCSEYKLPLLTISTGQAILCKK